MSFVPGSEPRDFWLVVGGAATLVGALMWSSRREDLQPGRIVSRCADGSVIGAWSQGVRRRPAPGPGARFGWRALRRWRSASRTRVREDLQPGDLSFIRIREAAAGSNEWVVEGLDTGPGYFRVLWVFDAPDPALAAYRLLEERIARAPLDAHGRAVTLTDREFDAMWSLEPPEGVPASGDARPHHASPAAGW